MNRKPEERDKFINEREFKKLLLAADRHGDDEFMLIFLGGALGLRVGEAVSLERDNFRKVRGNLVEVHTFKQKGRPVRSVGIDDLTRGIVLEFLAKLPNGQRFLFPGDDRGHIGTRTAERHFKRAVIEAGLNPQYSFHALRHYRGLRAWKQSKDIKFVQEQMRHRSMKNSFIYIHLDDEAKVEQARRIAPL